MIRHQAALDPAHSKHGKTFQLKRRVLIWPILLLLHLAVLIGWHERPRHEPPAQRVSLWIVSASRHHAPAPEARERSTPAPRNQNIKSPASAIPAPAPAFNPEAITLPAVPQPAASAPLALPKLNLALPPRSASQAWANIDNPAVHDPRSNTPHLSFGERMAEALGTDQSVKVIELQNGGKRVRQGNSCYQTAPSRTAELNPMDDRWRDMPSMAGSCPH